MEEIEAYTSTDSGNRHIIPWKLEVSTSFHGGKLKTINFHGKFYGSKTKENLLQYKIFGGNLNGSRSNDPHKSLVEAAGGLWYS